MLHRHTHRQKNIHTHENILLIFLNTYVVCVLISSSPPGVFVIFHFILLINLVTGLYICYEKRHNQFPCRFVVFLRFVSQLVYSFYFSFPLILSPLW